MYAITQFPRILLPENTQNWHFAHKQGTSTMCPLVDFQPHPRKVCMTRIMHHRYIVYHFQKIIPNLFLFVFGSFCSFLFLNIVYYLLLSLFFSFNLFFACFSISSLNMFFYFFINLFMNVFYCPNFSFFYTLYFIPLVFFCYFTGCRISIF